MKKIISLASIIALSTLNQVSIAAEDAAPAPKHEMKMDHDMGGKGKMEGMSGMGQGKKGDMGKMQGKGEMDHGKMGGMGGMGDMGEMDHGKMREHLKMKQDYQLKLHALTNKILAEKDPTKQQALKDEQLKLMEQHHMQMMKMHKMMKGHKM